MSREQALGFFERVEGDPLYGYVSVGDLKGSFNVVYDDMSYPIPVVYDVTALPNPGQDGQMFYISSTGDIVVWTKGAYKVNAQGEPGAQGPQGPPGIQNGPPGPVGLTGPAGPAGITGPQGPIGSVGAIGPQGNPGGGVTVLGAITDTNQPDTSNIVAGTMYIVGAGGCTHIGAYTLPTAAVAGEGLVWTGGTWVNVGPIRGPMGPIGSQGIQGAVGSTGAQGPAGSQGVQGPAGPKGIQGVKGDVGAKGATGSAGITGSDGAQGASGPKGDKGDQGDQGSQGPKGDKGNTGDTGAVGPRGDGLALAGTAIAEPANPTSNGVYMYIGDTLGYWGSGTPAPITLYPNECALWTGSVWINVGKIRGPVGLTGATGASGPTGAPGAQGPSGQTGPAGLQGPAGSTGATGPMGPKGDAGDVGPTGIGLQGPAGVTGPAGPKGDVGSTGATGPQGSVGPQGPQGLKGDAGPQGSQGLKGDAGSVGATGATGVKGDTGLQGPTGPQGVKGNTGDGLTIRGVLTTQAQVNTANTTALEGYIYEVGGNGLSFTGITGSPVVGDIVTKMATGWLNNGALKGPAGPAGPTGPTAVSGNSGNNASLGTDGLVFVPDAITKQVIAGVGLQGGGKLTADVTLSVKPGPGLVANVPTGTVDVSFGVANNQAARGDHGHADMPLLNGSRSFTGGVTVDQGAASVLTLKGTSTGGAKIVLAADGTSTIVTVTGGIAVKDSTLAAYRNLEVAAPTANQHAATKQYVDSKIIAGATQPTGAAVVEGTVWVQV